MGNLKCLLTLILGLVLFSACLKNVKPAETETNVFDPDYNGPIWYEEVSLDSTQIAGVVYSYYLTFRLLNEDLINKVQDFTIKIRRWNKSEFKVIPYVIDHFGIQLLAGDRVAGKFNLDIALYGEYDTQEVLVQHVSQW